MSIIIKRATVDDVSAVAPLFDAYRQFYKQPSNIAAAENFLLERLQQNESVIFIAFDENNAVGFTQLYPIFSSVSMRRAWLLNDLYVSNNQRTKGAGTLLLEAAKNLGVETNSKWLLLETANDNTTAQKVYEKNSWQKVTDYCFYTLTL